MVAYLFILKYQSCKTSCFKEIQFAVIMQSDLNNSVPIFFRKRFISI